ncbi:hypothetical protein [Jiangella anatolica]|uniref:Uncharacterized protein n=1 Tax=Jiangella anatolica TaxID=2670374 RepID=A0A2W2B0W6_9ACTN|nr:hypothetical protein [Jiangella anatolica]PZF81091.1 hypothetical protein C1I92_22570 [Jiangella anatolica]
MRLPFRRRSGRAVSGLVLASLLAVAPGTMVAGAESQLPGTVENLGTPISSFLILDSVQGVDKDGRPMLYGSTYAASSPGVTFFAIDIETGDVVKQLPMTGSWGGYHTEIGTDGKVYLTTQSGDGLAHLWAYDPKKEQIGIVKTSPETDIGHTFFFGVKQGERSKLYLGTYPSGKLYEYHQPSGRLRDVGVVQEGRNYAKAIVPLDSLHVFVGGGTPAAANIVNVRTGAKTNILPAAYEDYAFAYNATRVGDDLLVQLVGGDSRTLRFELTGSGATFAGEVPQLSGYTITPIDDDRAYALGACTGQAYGVVEYNVETEECTRLTDASWVSGTISEVEIDGESWLVSIGSAGLFGRFNPATGELITEQRYFPGSGTNVWALRTGPDGNVYGGTYETNALFRIDPGTAQTTVLGPVAVGASGEILSMASTDDELYMSSYTHNIVTVYDPSKPWHPGVGETDNPLSLGPVGDQQYRPWDTIRGSSGDIFVASGAIYGALGGALTRIDDETHAVQSWRYLAGDQNMFSLAAGAGEIYLGSTTHGDGVQATGEVELMVIDEATNQVTERFVPTPGAKFIFSLATAADGTVYGVTDNGRWFRFDPDTRTVTSLGDFPLGTATALATGPDGVVYGLTAGALFRIDAATDTVTALTDVGGTFYRTIAFDDAGRVYWGNWSEVMRWTP